MANYTLTSIADGITGSTLDDAFTGTYDAVPGVDTFNGTDILDGGDGIDTLNIDHFVDVAITPPDTLWSGISNIEKIVISTTGAGAQTLVTGSAFEAAFAAAGVDLETTTTGDGAINLTMSSFTGTATIAATSTAGAQTIITGSGASDVTSVSGPGALIIKGVGLETVSATTTGAGAQTIGDGSGNGANLVTVDASSSGGAQTIISTSTSNVTIDAISAAGVQIITTGDGNDVITAGTAAANNQINTGAGNDGVTVLETSVGTFEINGGTGNDSMYAGAGADTLTGDIGNDILDGKGGADSMVGGDGSDRYVVDSGADIVTETNAVTSTGGFDSVYSYLAAYTLGSNFENGVVRAAGAADMTGNGLNNVIVAGDGDNLLNGDTGNDTAAWVYATGGVTVSLDVLTAQATGGSGSDTLAGFENLRGSSFDDSLTGDAGANVLSGMAGADTLTGGDGSDIYLVDNAGDVVTETNATASVGGHDAVNSYISAYTLTDNVENGAVKSAGAADLTGNALDNTLHAGAGDNVLNGDAGTDTAAYVHAAGGVTVSLAVSIAQATGGSGSDTLVNIENLRGSGFDDNLTGNAGKNVLVGKAGADTLTGGGGNDAFSFDALSDMGTLVTTRDVITDFVQGEDVIRLSSLDANTDVGGNSAFSGFIASGDAFTAAGQLMFADGVLYGNTDADALAEFSIALTGVVSLSAGDCIM